MLDLFVRSSVALISKLIRGRIDDNLYCHRDEGTVRKAKENRNGKTSGVKTKVECNFLLYNAVLRIHGNATLNICPIKL